jgi:hypothetical protein
VVAGAVLDPWLFSGAGLMRADAMSVPVVAFIRQQLAGGISSMDLDRFRAEAGEEVQIDPGWAADPDPAPTVPSSVFWAWVIDDLFFHGLSSLVVLARDWTGAPVQFRRVLPGQLTYDPTTYAWGLITQVTPIYYRGRLIDPADVVVINGPHEGLLNYGGTILQAALDLEAAASRAAAEPLPNVELHQRTGEPLTPDDAADLVARWGASRARGATAYTPANIETKAVGFSSSDQQLIEGRQYMATQLARLAGVNPVLVSAAMGSSSSYVYTNQADYRQSFLDDVMDPYLRAIEGRLSANDVSPRGQFFRFDRDAFTHLTQMQRAQIMIGALRSQAEPERIDQVARSIGVDPAAGGTAGDPVRPADAVTQPAPRPQPQPAAPRGAAA